MVACDKNDETALQPTQNETTELNIAQEKAKVTVTIEFDAKMVGQDVHVVMTVTYDAETHNASFEIKGTTGGKTTTLKGSGNATPGVNTLTDMQLVILDEDGNPTTCDYAKALIEECMGRFWSIYSSMQDNSMAKSGETPEISNLRVTIADEDGNTISLDSLSEEDRTAIENLIQEGIQAGYEAARTMVENE